MRAEFICVCVLFLFFILFHRILFSFFGSRKSNRQWRYIDERNKESENDFTTYIHHFCTYRCFSSFLSLFCCCCMCMRAYDEKNQTKNICKTVYCIVYRNLYYLYYISIYPWQQTNLTFSQFEGGKTTQWKINFQTAATTKTKVHLYT